MRLERLTVTKFQTIFAISAEDITDPSSWRQKSLIAAANRTDLEIHIIQSAEPTESELKELMEAGNGAHPSRGQALAWKAHLRILERFVPFFTLPRLVIPRLYFLAFIISLEKHFGLTTP